jgi:hypothetical protein
VVNPIVDQHVDAANPIDSRGHGCIVPVEIDHHNDCHAGGGERLRNGAAEASAGPG